MPLDKQNEIRKMFEEYDTNYKSMEFPFTDDEFILKYNYTNK